MPKLSPQPDLDPPRGERQSQLVLSELASRPRSVARPKQSEGLRRLLAVIDHNRHLSAQVRRLEGELRRSAAELAELRGDLRSAVHAALTDPLTGLPNRRSFDREVDVIVARGDGSPAHLVMADIDYFKRINDRHGHDTGDQVLRIVAAVLCANVRHDGVVARVGGDEFGLLIPGAGAQVTNGIMARLCRLFASRPMVIRNQPEVIERLTLSMGVAGWQPGEAGAQWRARADAALYEAKRRGRSQVVVDSGRPTATNGGSTPARWPSAVS